MQVVCVNKKLLASQHIDQCMHGSMHDWRRDGTWGDDEKKRVFAVVLCREKRVLSRRTRLQCSRSNFFLFSGFFFVFFNDVLVLADQAELAHEMEARSMKDSMRERGEKIPNLLLVI